MSLFLSSALLNRPVNNGPSHRARLNLGSALGSASAALLFLSLTATPAQAADECGAPIAGTVTCGPSGNPYADGINYDAGVDDLTVVLEDGVEIESIVSTGINITGTGGTLSLSQDQGSITAKGINASGVVIIGGGSVNASLADVTSEGDNGNGVRIDSNEDIDLKITGDVKTLGNGSSEAVILTATSGTVKAGLNNISTDGDNAEAIKIRSNDLLLTATGTVSTTGANAMAINANSYNSATIHLNSISTSGDFSGGLKANAKYDIDLTITGAVDVAGQGSATAGNAIDLITTHSGSVTADINKVSTIGDQSSGVVIDSKGSTELTVGSVSTAGLLSRGVSITTEDDLTIIATGDISTLGESARAVHLFSNSGDITATFADISTASDYADGISAYSNTGSVTATVANVTTAGDSATGIYIVADQGIELTVTGMVSTIGDAAMGLEVDAHGSANVTVGQISTLGDNSDGARVNAREDLTIVSTDGITTQGAQSFGIGAESRTGSITITASNVTTGGFEASGIEAISYDSFATVTANNVTTAGDNAHGVDVRSMDAVATATATNVATSGEGAFGVVVGTVTGSVSVTATDITTTGVYGVGVAAHSYGDGALSVVANNVSTTGADAFGVVAMSYGQSASSVTANNVSTTGADAYGVMVRTGLSADVVASNIATSGDNAHGILVLAQDQVNVSVTGPVSTTGAGAVAVGLQGQKDITFKATGPITTSGDNAIGVVVEGNSGATLITVADVETTGLDASGIFTDTYGDVTVKAGNISAAKAQAISAESTANITIATTGNITSASTNAIEMRADQLATIDIAAGSIIGGATSAIVGGGLDGIVINNDGTINAGSAETILSTVGPATLNNSGTFHGRVAFGSADDIIDNSGDFHAAGISNFGAGTNLFINSGTFTAESADIQGLSRFSNSGIVSLQNGAVGDHLTLSGDYYGEGGELAMDIDFAAGTADLLTIEGAATGATTVTFNAVGTPSVLGSSFIFVDAGAGSENNAFVADSVQAGFYGYIVTFDAANNDYLVTPSIGDATFGTLKFNEAAQSLWYKTADVVSAHLADRRHGSGHQNINGRIWGQLHGSYDKRDQILSYSTAGGQQTSDVSYRQDYFGGQLGVDLGAAESDFGFGLTAGYVNSKLKLAAREDRAKYDAFNFGAYAGYNGGKFFANLLAKYDVYNIKARSVLGDYAESFDGKSYGAQLEAGFRFGSDSFFAEPVASIAWVRTDLDKLAVSNAVIDFDKMDGLRGKLGARIGGISPMAGGSFTWYAGGHAVKEFEGRDGVTFLDGVNTVHLANQRIGTYGQADVGISIVSANGVAGFIEGNAKFGDEYRGYGGRVGLRLAF
ncbi:MAG TPA: autotransporter domain-containing protein [Sphingopyxis sp.]|nr:autotransporter domain-containing protein [Sphingopyxis sp.]